MSNFTPEHIAATGRELMRLGSAMMLNPGNIHAEGLDLNYEEIAVLVAIGHRRLSARPAIITDTRIHNPESREATDIQGNIVAISYSPQDIQITIRKF
jgi:hypothetical protein